MTDEEYEEYMQSIVDWTEFQMVIGEGYGIDFYTGEPLERLG